MSVVNHKLFSKDLHRLKSWIPVPVAIQVISFSFSRLEKNRMIVNKLKSKIKQAKKIMYLTGRLHLLNFKLRKERKLKKMECHLSLLNDHTQPLNQSLILV